MHKPLYPRINKFISIVTYEYFNMSYKDIKYEQFASQYPIN